MQPSPSFRTRLRRLLQLGASRGPAQALRALARTSDLPELYPSQLAFARHPFDLEYGVETSGYQHGEALHEAQRAASPEHRAFFGPGLWNTAYYAITPSIFDRALELTGVTDWSRFTFLDLGCGKGRALLLASRQPFLRILGVELDAALAAQAQQNLLSFHASWQRCHSFAVRQQDATTVDLPRTPLLLFLYHPFLAPVLRRVLRRLEQSLRVDPRELWMVYVNPEAASALRTSPLLHEHARAVFQLAGEDLLADRLGSTREEVRVYHFLPEIGAPHTATPACSSRRR